MAAKMVTDLISVRYTGDPKLIEECLKEFFPESAYPGVKCTYEVISIRRVFLIIPDI